VRIDQLQPRSLSAAAWRTLWIGLAVVAALMPALAARVLAIPVAWALAIALGLALDALSIFSPTTLAAALIVATAIAGTSFIPDAGSALPAVALGIPLVATAARDWRRDPSAIHLPSRWVMAAAFLCLGVMIISIIAGAATGWRPNYPIVLTGLVSAGLLLGLVVVPHVVSTSSDRLVLLASLVALGPLLLIASIVLAATGPIPLDGAWVGAWLHAELTMFGHPTGLVFVRVTGPFARPAGAATILAVSATALLGLRRSVGAPARLALTGLLPVLAILLFIAQNRGGWLIVAVTASLYAVVGLWRERRLDIPAVVMGVVFFALLGAISVDAIGADVRQDASIAAYGPAIAATVPGADEDMAATIRGGTGLSGRQYLWRASIDAIIERPLLGWGLGSDEEAIRPLLDPSATRFAGATSDSMYLVTTVETGLVGLIALSAFIATSLVAVTRRLLTDVTVDPTGVTMGVTFAGLLAGAAFETYRLGWVVYPSFELALAVGLALVGPAVASTRLSPEGPDVREDAMAPSGVGPPGAPD
jgi:O-antigen ligase